MTKSNTMSAQNYFFSQIKKYNILVNIYLKSGLKFVGHVLAHDKHSLLFRYKCVDTDRCVEALYMKINIVSILPFEPLLMDDVYESL